MFQLPKDKIELLLTELISFRFSSVDRKLEMALFIISGGEGCELGQR